MYRCSSSSKTTLHVALRLIGIDIGRYCIATLHANIACTNVSMYVCMYVCNNIGYIYMNILFIDILNLGIRH